MSLLLVPCKKSSDVNISKPIETYIRKNFGEKKALECKRGLEKLQMLRDSILSKIDNTHESTINTMYEYCDMLETLEQRIPLTNQDIPIAFKWYECFGGSSKFLKSSMIGYNGGFDRCCMLFNCAACHTQIANVQDISTDSGLQSAAKSFQVAAGLFDHVKCILPSFYTQSPTWDMSVEALTAYSAVMLAQAQECIFMKAERDNMKPLTVAKLANQTATLYSEAAVAVSISSLKSYLPKDWLNLISTKNSILKINVEYYGSMAAANSHSYGEQIARLNKATSLLKRIPRNDTTKALSTNIEKTLQRAKKDNLLIYHESVPDAASLPAIGVVTVAKKLPVTFPLLGNPPEDLFKGLVPIPVHNALQVAESVRQRIISTELGRLREATEMCNSVLTSLNLPAAVQSAESEGVVPESLLAKAVSIRQQGGVNELREKLSLLSTGVTRNTEIVNAIASTVDEEEKTDNDLRTKYGDKWNRQPSSKLNAAWRSEMAKHRELMIKSSQNDGSIKDRFHKDEALFEILSRPESELRAYITSAMEGVGSAVTTAGGSENDRAIRELCSKIDSMKKERIDLQKQLETIAVPDDLSDVFQKIYNSGGQIDAQDIASEHIIAALRGARECVQESLTTQESLLQGIQAKYESAFGRKKVDATVVTSLLMAAEAYELLKNDLEQGLIFYSTLTDILLKFQNKVTDFEFARQTEKKELMSDINREMSRIEGGGEMPSRPPPTYVNPQPASAGATQQFGATQISTNPSAPPVYGQQFWPGYNAQPPTMPFVPPGIPHMPMYGNYPMPMYPMPGLPPPQQPQQPPP